MTSSLPPTARAQPFYCPYCGEQDFVPAEQTGEFHCNSCDRFWVLRFLGTGAGSSKAEQEDVV